MQFEKKLLKKNIICEFPGTSMLPGRCQSAGAARSIAHELLPRRDQSGERNSSYRARRLRSFAV